MRARLMTVGVIYCVFSVLSLALLWQVDLDNENTIFSIASNIPLFRIAGSILLSILSYQYAASIQRRPIIWALGAFLLPFFIPLILCFLQSPYSLATDSKQKRGKEKASEELENLKSNLSPFEVFLNSKDKTVYKRAFKQINDQAILAELLETVKEKEKIVLLLRKLKNQTVIEKYAQEHPDNGVRISAIKQLTNQDLLSQIAQHDTINGARMAAVANITDKQVLENILQEDTHSGVRDTAKKILGKTKKKSIAIVYGGFGEPYCSQDCYDKGGKYSGSVMLKNQAGLCGFCQKPVQASMYGTSDCAIVPYEGVNLFICSSCATQGRAHLRDHRKCCMCQKSL